MPRKKIEQSEQSRDKYKLYYNFVLYIPVFIEPIDGTILGIPDIGATMPVVTIPNGCVGNGCAMLKAAIGTGFVFKGAIGATDGIPS